MFLAFRLCAFRVLLLEFGVEGFLDCVLGKGFLLAAISQNPKPHTLNPKPETLNSTPKLRVCVFASVFPTLTLSNV